MADTRIEITLTGDPSGLKKATLEAADAIDRLQKTGEKFTEQTKKHTAAADAFLERMKQEAIQLTAGDLALKKYQLSKLGLADAELKAANALAENIDRLKQHERAARDSTTGQESLTASMFKGVIGADLAMQAFGKVVAVYKEMKTATQEAQQVELRTQAVLRASGELASGKREIIERLAESMKRLTRFDDDQVKATAQQLLTLGLSNDKFERAIKLGADLAVTYNRDLTSSVMTLGKALVEPGEALGGLERLMGKFDPAIKRQIKNFADMNEEAKAQNLILQEVSRVAGVAEGAYSGVERTTVGLANAWSDMLKAMGAKIFDQKTTEAGYLETRLKNITSAINSDMPTWLKALDVLGSLTAAWVPGMDVAGDIEARKKWSGSNSATGRIKTADGGDAGEAAKRAADALELIKKTREGFRTNAEKLTIEVDRIKKLARDAGLADAEVADIIARIQARYAEKPKADNSALKEAERLQKNRMANLKAEAELQEESAQTRQKDLEGATKIQLALRDGNELMRAEIEALGLTRTERELLINAKQKEIALNGVLDTQERANIAALYDQKAALIEVRNAKQDGIAATVRYGQEMQQLGDRILDALLRGKEGIKDFGREMAAVFLKKWVLNLAASVTGSSSLNALAASAGQSSAAGALMNSAGGSAIGNALGIGTGSIFGGSAAYGAALGTTSIGAGSQAAMLAAQTAEFGAAGLGATASAAGGAAGSMTGMLAAAGPYAAAALAIYAIYKMFAKPRGGAKQGGSFQGQYNAAGLLTGTDPAHLFGLKPEESVGNPQVAASVGNYSSALTNLIKNLGGTARGFTMGVGYDEDPRGTAQSRVTGILRDAAGNVIYSEKDREIGRDPNRVGPEVQLTLSRMILAGVKNSNLPEHLAKILDGVVIETQTQEQLDALVTKLSETKAAWDGLTDGITAAGNVIDSLAGNNLPGLTTQLQALRDAVGDADTVFNAALAGGDAIQIRAAEDALLNAVVNRYQTEMNAIAELQAGLAALKDGAYQFRMANAARINKYGGNVDIGDIAWGRAGELRAGIESGGTPQETMDNVGAYLGAIDAWVSAQESALQSQSEMQSAIAQASQAAAQDRIAQLQQELAISQQWAGVLQSAEQAINAMRLTATNPLTVFGRQAMATGDVNDLLGQYRGATGSAKADLAGKLISAVGVRQGLNESAWQRPSQEYLDAYNANIAILTEVQGEAKTEAEKQTDIQSRIEDLQRLANSYANSTAGATAAANGALAGIHAQARELAIWAGDKYDLAAQAQEKLLTDQLMLITGGLDVGLYTAKLQTEIRDVLTSIDSKITAFLTGQAIPSGGGSSGTVTIPGGSLIGGGGFVGPMPPGGSAGGSGVAPTVTRIEVGGQMMVEFVNEVVDNRIVTTSTRTRRESSFS